MLNLEKMNYTTYKNLKNEVLFSTLQNEDCTCIAQELDGAYAFITIYDNESDPHLEMIDKGVSPDLDFFMKEFPGRGAIKYVAPDNRELPQLDI